MLPQLVVNGLIAGGVYSLVALGFGKELLKSAKRKEVLELRGKVKWESDLEELRRSRL